MQSSKHGLKLFVRKIVLILFCLIFTVEVVSADVIFPLSFVTLPFFPLILVIEVLVFVVYVKCILAKTGLDISLKRAFLTVFTANLASSAVGLIFPTLHDSLTLTILSALLLSIIVEFFVYVMLLRIRKLELLKLSSLTNFASYTALIFYLLLFIKIDVW